MSFRFDVKPPAGSDLPAFTVSCNTPAEASHLVKALTTDGGIAFSNEPITIVPPPAQMVLYARSPVVREGAAELPITIRVLQAIQTSPGGITTDTLCSRFGFTTGRALGGVMMALYRKLKDLGVTSEEVVHYERLRQGEGSVWHPRPGIDEAVRQLLEAEGGGADAT